MDDEYAMQYMYDIAGLEERANAIGQFCKGVADFTARLIDIQHNYSAALSQLIKRTQRTKTPQGSMGVAWESLIGNMSSTVEQHEEYCRLLSSEIMRPLKGIIVSDDFQGTKKLVSESKQVLAAYVRARREYVHYLNDFARFDRKSVGSICDTIATNVATFDDDGAESNDESNAAEVDSDIPSAETVTKKLRRRSVSDCKDRKAHDRGATPGVKSDRGGTLVKRSESFNLGDFISRSATEILRKKPKTRTEAAVMCVGKWEELLRAHGRLLEANKNVSKSMIRVECALGDEARDAMRKYVVFRSSLCANNQFDIQSMAKISENVNVRDDIKSHLEHRAAKGTPYEGTKNELAFESVTPPPQEIMEIAKRSDNLHSRRHDDDDGRETDASTHATVDDLAQKMKPHDKAGLDAHKSPSKLQNLYSRFMKKAETAVAKFASDVMSPPKKTSPRRGIANASENSEPDVADSTPGEAVIKDEVTAFITGDDKAAPLGQSGF